MSGDVVIEGLDLVDVMTQIDKKKKKFIAIMLSELEDVYDKDSEQFLFIRKIILDGVNDYTRSFMRIFFGDIEGLLMK